MKILSMTATFGKLNQQTISFEDGLNVLHAPNEWGKSTWCAFMTAMLYGIDTRQRNTEAQLADKEHYAPWSGAPMAGRMEIIWEGRKITMERTSKGRGILNQFRAYETDTGADVPELQAETCGQTLLGVEKEVFQRSAFLKLTDLPVSDTPALRSRLNALVSTGDESGTAEVLAKKLKDLKNKCRHNKTGLLPEAEKIRDGLLEKLEKRLSLQDQHSRLSERLSQLEDYGRKLQNHQDALAYQENFSYAQKLTAAQTAALSAKQDYEALQAECASLPGEAEVRNQLSLLRQYREEKEGLQMQAQMLPPAPTAPIAPEVFRALTGKAACEKAQEDKKAYDALTSKMPRFSIAIAAALLAAAIGLAIIPGIGLFLAPLPLVGIGIYGLIYSMQVKAHHIELGALLSNYPGITPDRWVAIAEGYAAQEETYLEQKASHDEECKGIRNAVSALQEKIENLAKGQSLAQYEWQLQSILEKHSALGDKKRNFAQKAELAQTLEGSQKAAPAPAFPDELTFTGPETDRLLSDNAAQQNSVRHQLGQLLGQMETLGQEEALNRELSQIRQRIALLEKHYKALETAMDFLEKARAELQKRFAPRISQKAQEYMGRLTGGRYNRLFLDGDFVLNAGTTEDITPRPSRWRSDGTVDQLYLALRLAVSQELMPGAPMILDDALVRFDEERMKAALDLLKEESAERQIILFSCQKREEDYING